MKTDNKKFYVLFATTYQEAKEYFRSCYEKLQANGVDCKIWYGQQRLQTAYCDIFVKVNTKENSRGLRNEQCYYDVDSLANEVTKKATQEENK